MENKDNKLDEQFRQASRKEEDKDFAQMESIWNRVEEKLDATERKRKNIPYWKYGGVAALLLLCLTVGNFIFRNNENRVIPPTVQPSETVVSIDTAKVQRVVEKSGEVGRESVVVNESANRQKDETTVSASENSLKPVRNARFSTAKEIDDSESYFYTDKITFVPGNKERKANSTKTENNKYVSKASIEDKAKPVDEPFPFTVTVTDTQGMPIPGVTVAVNGGQAAQTDFDGKTTLNTNAGDTLTLSFIGMETKNMVALPSNNYANVAMADDLQNRDEVVVVEAYRTTSKKYDASVAAISSETIEKSSKAKKAEIIRDKEVRSNNQLTSGYLPKDQAPVKIGTGEVEIIEGKPKVTVAESLKNQVPGLNISTETYIATPDKIYGGNEDIVLKGRPNTTVVLRGLGSINNNPDPMYVINGIPATLEDFRRIKSDDIKEISVLKDAGATSIYGSRGANGVIMVKTKEPLSGKEIKRLKANWKLEQEKGIVPPIKVDTEEYESFEENKFENPKTSPLSTFSIDVDNASYTNIRRFLNEGQVVPKDAVRVEEMINFFKYDYPQPVKSEPFSITTEYSDAPWNPQHKLLKIGLKGKDIPTDDLPASNLVFLIDVSGSMSDINKLPLLKQSMKLLVNQMRKEDRVAIVVYAGAAGLVLPSTSGAEKEKIIAALDNLNAGGSTAGGEGIELAYKTAQENFIKKGNNRVILATDGDFNVGKNSNADMQTLIEEKRKSGVFLTCLGYGMGNYKDSKMEVLADKGNGNYAYIDNMQEAGRFLDKEFKGSMYAIAKDVKIQIEFNPAHVQSYRLIGYENRKLRDEDFANDAIDAGELGSGHTVTALYEIIPAGVKSDFFTAAPELKYTTPQSMPGNKYGNELATIKFRHKKPDEDVSREMVKIIPNISMPIYSASGDFKFAAAVAWFGLKLRDSKLVSDKDSQHIKELAKQGLANDREGYRAEFIRIVEMVK